jgi:predicted ATP-dependent serine protease
MVDRRALSPAGRSGNDIWEQSNDPESVYERLAHREDSIRSNEETGTGSSGFLEKRAGYFMGNCDIFVNVAGGLKIDEPASDLPVALTLISSLKDEVIRDDCIAFGEIGLAGEIRSVGFAELRIKEAIRLGFRKCIISEHNIKELPKDFYNQIEIVGVSNIRSAYYESTK